MVEMWGGGVSRERTRSTNGQTRNITENLPGGGILRTNKLGISQVDNRAESGAHIQTDRGVGRQRR